MIRKGICFFILSLAVSILQGQDDPVLFTVEDSDVKVSEFDYIYSKNNAGKADYSKSSVEEYLDLYINFKLKVAEARSKKIDTLDSYIKELAGYRRQLADSYIVERELAKSIAKEAYERKKQDIEIAHILIKLPRKSGKAAEKEAYAKAEAALKELKNGRSFESVVEEFSEEDKSKKRGGNAGFITAILPDGFYDLESAIYNTPLGQTSEIVRSQLGLHIVKVLSKRPARGKMTIAHILIRSKYKGVDNPDALNEAKEVHKRLEKGESFESVASQFSQDNNTKLKGGLLSEFGIGRYEKGFEDAAFGLKKDGDFTGPIESRLGFHIIKRISKAEEKSFEDSQKDLIKNTKQSDRQEAGKKLLNEQIKKEAGHICFDDVMNDFIKSLDSEFYEFRWKIPEFQDRVLCKLGDEEFMLSDFADFCKKQGRMRMQFPDGTPIETAVKEIYTKYTDQKAIDYQQDRLEEKYIDFRNLMREYEEGILLFEVTKEEVWDMASNDSVGIENYYAQNKEKYFWPERAEVEEYSLRTTDAELIAKILKKAGKNDADKVATSFNKEDSKTELVMWKDKTYEKSDSDVKGIPWKGGGLSAPKINNALRMTTFKRIKNIKPKEQKSLDDARGFVISDYQQVLEQKWIDTLKEKYSVEVDDKVLKQLIK